MHQILWFFFEGPMNNPSVRSLNIFGFWGKNFQNAIILRRPKLDAQICKVVLLTCVWLWLWKNKYLNSFTSSIFPSQSDFEKKIAPNSLIFFDGPMNNPSVRSPKIFGFWGKNFQNAIIFRYAEFHWPVCDCTVVHSVSALLCLAS